MLYRERVTASPWFRIAVPITLVVSLGAALVAVLTDEDAGVVDAVVTGLSFAFGVALAVVLDRWFMALDVRVDRREAVAAFGPFRRRLPAREVVSAVDERYPWVRYGGWGIRSSFGDRRAWTVPFLRTGVAVALRNGKRYFVSSRSPERLRRAIEEMVAEAGRGRG